MRKNPWIYYGKKLLIFVVSIFLLSVIVFYIARLAPGDPLVSYYGDRAEKMTAGERAWAEEKLGLPADAGTDSRSVPGSTHPEMRSAHPRSTAPAP